MKKIVVSSLLVIVLALMPFAWACASSSTVTVTVPAQTTTVTSTATSTGTTTVTATSPPVTITTTLPVTVTTTAPTSPVTAPPTTTQYTINVAINNLMGQILVAGNGMTLYWTTADSPGVNNVTGAAASIWPIFYTSTIVVPSSLNASDFGTITNSDGSKQTTYKQWPLYFYINDTAPGDTNGQGVAGKWSVVNPGASGPQPIATTTTTTPTTTPTTPTTTTPTTPTTTPTTSATGQTYGALASLGSPIYSSTCAICHGPNGQGTDICPVVMWGTGSGLGSFNGVTLFTDAAGMLSYMSKSMPLTAPGSLSSQQYIDLLGYILIQANKVTPTTIFDQSALSSIAIP